MRTAPMLVGDPLIAGRAVFTGAEVSTAVGSEVAVAGPVPFVAVTEARRVEPTSEAVVTYVERPVPMLVQFAPLVSHRFHWYAHTVGE